jgi:hypothetical protein
MFCTFNDTCQDKSVTFNRKTDTLAIKMVNCFTHTEQKICHYMTIIGIVLERSKSLKFINRSLRTHYRIFI